jgi:Immunity protein 26
MSTDFKRPKLPDFKSMSDEQVDHFVDQFEGVFFAIPLDGQFCFGRVHRRSITACYDRLSPTILPIDEIERLPILFRSTGAISAVLGGRRWKILGKKPLTGAVAEPSKFFRETYLAGFIDIYCDGAYQPYAGEDLSQIDRLGIATPWHVARSLRWHFGDERHTREGHRFNPRHGRELRLKYRAKLAAGEIFEPKLVQFLLSTTEEQLDSFGFSGWEHSR